MFNVEYIIENIHSIADDNGFISYSPALREDSRLYIIHNPKAARQFYIGTSVNVKQRFEGRLDALRDCGLQNMLSEIVIVTVQIKINTKFCPPGTRGISMDKNSNTNIDVEHILIRSYIKNFGLVNNTNKVGPFSNKLGQAINCTFSVHDKKIPLNFIIYQDREY